MTTSTTSPTDPKATIERLLEEEQVLVHINPATHGVVIPPHLLNNRTVTLRLSRFFKGDMTINEEKVTAELLFGRDYFTCELPWSSIWGASSIRGQEFIWAEAAPDEVLQMFLAQREERVIKERTEPLYGTLPPPFPPPSARTRRTVPYLRRVK